jgi:hypothetical protein
MAAAVEVKFYNSFLLRKVVENLAGATTPPVWQGSPGIPENVDGSFPQYTELQVTKNKCWIVEESRIRGGFNNTEMLYGVKAYLVDAEPNANFRTSSLIYSGIYNSRTGINDTNVFSVGEDITKSLDPSQGSVQKLYAEDTNLIIFQENKVNRALIDKDAIYTAEGNASAVSQLNLVIGQIVPYAGNFGISKDPQSFAVYGYRKYFTDKDRNAVMRLSQDGLTEISSYGMIDYFRDQLNDIDIPTEEGKIIGGWDIYTKQYVLSLQKAQSSEYQTFNYDGSLWQHNDAPLNESNRSKFYGTYSPSNITFVFNPKVSMSKVFKTINYEGSAGWEVTSFNAARSFELNDTAAPIKSYGEGAYVDGGVTYYAGFYKKEGKYFANVVNDSPPTAGEVVFGDSMSGVKGYYSTVTIQTDASTQVVGQGGEVRELFAVSSEYAESSY